MSFGIFRIGSEALKFLKGDPTWLRHNESYSVSTNVAWRAFSGYGSKANSLRWQMPSGNRCKSVVLFKRKPAKDSPRLSCGIPKQKRNASLSSQICIPDQNRPDHESLTICPRGQPTRCFGGREVR